MSTSTTSRHTRKTAQEMKAQAEALHSPISEQVGQLSSSEKWQTFLNFAQAFRAYFLNNPPTDPLVEP